MLDGAPVRRKKQGPELRMREVDEVVLGRGGREVEEERGRSGARCSKESDEDGVEGR